MSRKDVKVGGHSEKDNKNVDWFKGSGVLGILHIEKKLFII